MLIQLSCWAIAALVLIGSIVFGIMLDDRRKNPALFILTGILSAVAVLILSIVIIVTAIARPIGKSTCANWSKQTGIPTKFVILNSWDTGTCLAKTPNGHWVDNSNWGSFNN